MCFFKLEFKPGVGGGFLRAFTSQKGPGKGLLTSASVRQAVGAAQDLGGDEADGHGWFRFCRAAALESASGCDDQHGLRGPQFYAPKLKVELM